MLLQELSTELKNELRVLTTKYPKYYKALIKQLGKEARYYPSHEMYGIGSYWAKDTHILGQHWFYNNLIKHDAIADMNNRVDNMSDNQIMELAELLNIK
jgi:hypothetical protein